MPTTLIAPGDTAAEVLHLRPDPDVDHNVLADRIRSTLGPLEARSALPHIHVLVEDDVALLHGDVATDAEADQIEAAVAAVSGVEGVESYLHIGLLPSDTRPSEGRRIRPPSAAMQRLLAVTEAAGFLPADLRVLWAPTSAAVPAGPVHPGPAGRRGRRRCPGGRLPWPRRRSPVAGRRAIWRSVRRCWSRR